MSVELVIGNIDLTPGQMSDLESLIFQKVKRFDNIGFLSVVFEGLWKSMFCVDLVVFTKHASLRSCFMASVLQRLGIPCIYYTDGIFEFGNSELNRVGVYPWYTQTGFPPLGDLIVSADKKYFLMFGSVKK